MRLSKKFPVPREIALLYEFVNSRDERSYVEQGARHVPGDELETVAQMEDWLHTRGLLEKGARIGRKDHADVLELRDALRDHLRRPSNARVSAPALTAVGAKFPLVAALASSGKIELRSAPNASAGGLGIVLSELHLLSQTGRLDRLKMCASDECGWIFFDLSKPGIRRWCSSALCGNRQKTRSYRNRQREA